MFKYNGKEQEEYLDWYNYGARFYDPTIGRWTSVDPLSEKYVSMSPYNYVANNPIKYINPNGKEIIIPRKHNRKQVLEYINSRSSGVFNYDKQGKLYLTDEVNDESEYGSSYYTDRIVEGIESDLTISIIIAEDFEMNVSPGDGETAHLDENLGGGCTIGGECTDQVVLLSGKNYSNPRLKDSEGKLLPLTE